MEQAEIYVVDAESPVKRVRQTQRDFAYDQMRMMSTIIFEGALQKFLDAGKDPKEAEQLAQSELVMGLANIVADRIRGS
jgi:hypothetical protein